MSFWNFFSSTPDIDTSHDHDSHFDDINPANGLPMLAGGAIDIEGNPYGMDGHDFGATDLTGWTDDL